MRDKLSSPILHTAYRMADRSRVRAVPSALPTLSLVAPETDADRRARLVYWIKKGMERVGIRDEATFARAIGAPTSTVNRWLSPQATAVPPLTWLGAISSALNLDPLVFALLPAIPDDPLAPFALDAPTDISTATAAARLALLDLGRAQELAQPAAPRRAGPPRKRPARAGLRCPQGRRDQ